MFGSHTITGLDIGTGSIKILTVQKKKKTSELEILGIVQVPSAGLRKGVIINPEDVSNQIILALEELQNLCGRKVSSVYTNIGGSHIFATPSRGVVAVSRADQRISQEDIERVMQAAQTFPLPSNKEILDVALKEFVIDGEKGIKEVLGMQGIRLEAEVSTLCGFAPYVKNLTSAVLNTGLQIDDIAISPLASAQSVLTPKQKELGVILLDIGAGTTSLAVFEEGGLLHATVFPVGSGNITNDIAIGLKTDIETAERIKLEFGTCVVRGRKKRGRSAKHKRREKVEAIGPEPITFSPKIIYEIIEARVSEIFELVNKELKKISRQAKLPAGVVLTGGGARLPKITDLAKKELKLPCQIGYPKGILGLEEDPSLALVSGLVLRGVHLEEEDKRPHLFGGGIGSRIRRIFRIFIP